MSAPTIRWLVFTSAVEMGRNSCVLVIQLPSKPQSMGVFLWPPKISVWEPQLSHCVSSWMVPNVVRAGLLHFFLSFSDSSFLSIVNSSTALCKFIGKHPTPSGQLDIRLPQDASQVPLTTIGMKQGRRVCRNRVFSQRMVDIPGRLLGCLSLFCIRLVSLVLPNMLLPRGQVHS